jgi:hypothetical protein
MSILKEFINVSGNGSGCVPGIVSLRSWIKGLGAVGRYYMHRLAEIVA